MRTSAMFTSGKSRQDAMDFLIRRVSKKVRFEVKDEETDEDGTIYWLYAICPSKGIHDRVVSIFEVLNFGYNLGLYQR